MARFGSKASDAEACSAVCVFIDGKLSLSVETRLQASRYLVSPRRIYTSLLTIGRGRQSLTTEAKSGDMACYGGVQTGMSKVTHSNAWINSGKRRQLTACIASTTQVCLVRGLEKP